ncbi:hypothetical protein Bca4012_073415 [Brassica carinata]|uniref:Protein kinase domain-containing protein n=1 Tax=Brassica carinata TaxID=52824 RepID=A0A8X7QPR9_BRACI|nr:hypothetical protein Bca52824_065734 [Brassica carinata]
MCLLPAMNSLATTIPVKTISVKHRLQHRLISYTTSIFFCKEDYYELSFATQIVHVVIAGNAVEFFRKLDRTWTPKINQNCMSPSKSLISCLHKYLDILTHALGYHDHSFARADISKLSFLRVVLKPLLNLILTVKTSCFSPYSILVLLEIFGMFGELSINYKLTGEARGYFHRDLKSENMFSKNVIIKITDLGVAWETYRLQSYVYTSKVDMWATGAILTKVVVSSLFLFPECDRYPNQRDMVEGAKSY